MEKWTIIEVLVVILGLFFTVGKPVLKLITSISGLTDEVKTTRNELSNLAKNNTQSHRDLYNRVNNHERRMGKLEGILGVKEEYEPDE